MIIISIDKTIENNNFKEIFKRSINYDYKNIKKELRDI